MNIFVYHENASDTLSFTKTGDAWAIDRDLKIFAVADSPLRCLIKDTKQYPFDDHGYKAASTFCNSFILHSKERINKKDFTEETLRDILIECNKDIKDLNKRLGKEYNDPLNYDLAETVGVGALIKDNVLYYGGLEDCYVNVLRGKELKNVANWNYQIMKAGRYLEKLRKENKLLDYIPKELQKRLKKENEWEPCWCNYLRNNINTLDEDKNLVGWGCFTGENKAEDFIQTHTVNLQEGDHILLFSDGMIPATDNRDFLNWFIKNVDSTFDFQYQMRLKIKDMFESSSSKEKTLIYFRY